MGSGGGGLTTAGGRSALFFGLSSLVFDGVEGVSVVVFRAPELTPCEGDSTLDSQPAQAVNPITLISRRTGLIFASSSSEINVYKNVCFQRERILTYLKAKIDCFVGKLGDYGSV